MKNLKFEFDNYDKVINLNPYSLILLKKKSYNIEGELIFFNDKEESYKFSLDSTINLNSLSALYKNDNLFLLWENQDTNVILSIFKIEDNFLSNKKQLNISYDFNKICKSSNFYLVNNNLIILWLESDYYSNDEFSKFNLSKQIYEIEESTTEIYLNLIKSENIIQNIDISCKHSIYNSILLEDNEKKCFMIWSYRNKLDQYKMLFIDINNNDCFYINTNQKVVKSITIFKLNSEYFVFWMNDNNNIYGKSIEIINDNYTLNKDVIKSLEDPFDLLYNKISYGGIDDDKLIQIPIHLNKNNIIEAVIHTSGRNSFIILVDQCNNGKMIIKFDMNKLESIDRTLISNDLNILTVSCMTKFSLNYLVFFKKKVINKYLLCYQERKNNIYLNKDYDINKLDEIFVELEQGLNEVNDNLMNYNQKNISIFKIFNTI